MAQAYVKEVNALIEMGQAEEVAVFVFDYLREKFEEDYHQPELSDFQQVLYDLRKYHRKKFHNLIDGYLTELPMEKPLTWREVRFMPERIRRCHICMGYTYTTSTNGKKATCNSEICRQEYEVRRKRGGEMYAPSYSRRVNEILVNPMPDSTDAKGNALLDSMERSAWNQRNPYEKI